jgi:peptide-methionine (S)-S-oxide reductase
MGIFTGASQQMVSRERALPGRVEPPGPFEPHLVLGTSLEPPFPAGLERAVLAMGCFWGAERRFWALDGVYTTAVGYAGGYTPNPTYEEVCSGRTGHAEAVLVVFDPGRVAYELIVSSFFEGHDPTQGMRQGGDVGTQYRSAIFATSPGQRDIAARCRGSYEEVLRSAGFGAVTTELEDEEAFYYAEPYHQQYLARHPGGYCGLGGTGVSCPVGLTGAP